MKLFSECRRVFAGNRCISLPVYFIAFVLPLIASAQMPHHRDHRYEEIDDAEGARRLQAFRNQRLDGDFCFRFELEHLPRRGATERYLGTMWGSWNEEGPVTRIELSSESGHPQARRIDLILQNGPEPMAWSMDVESGDFVSLQGGAFFEPLLPGIVYTAFDLLMPFVYWSNYRYEGAERIRSRIARYFLMFPGADSSVPHWLHAVRVGIDDTYNALLNIEVLETAEQTRSSFTVESFKKVQGQWIVKRIVMKDSMSKDRTRFKVVSASVGLALDKAIFSPVDTMNVPTIPQSMFQSL